MNRKRLATGLLLLLGAALLLTLSLALAGEEAPLEESYHYAPPYLVHNYKWGTQSSEPDCVSFGEKLLCAADDGVHGRELWISDGKQSGTELVVDIVPGEGDGLADSSLRYVSSVAVDPAGSFVLFSAGDYELWRTDGTTSGTYPVVDFTPDSGPSFPSLFVNGSSIFVTARDNSNDRQLWITDGTESGTRFVKDFNSTGHSDAFLGSEALGMDGYIVFNANDGEHGRELWRSDGTEAGTYMISDIDREEPHDFYPDNLTRLGDQFLFVVDDGVHGRELWRSDGTQAGTRLVKDITPGSESSSIYSLAEFGGYIYFLTGYMHWDDDESLWRTDGTEQGTVKIAQFGQSFGKLYSTPWGLTVVEREPGHTRDQPPDVYWLHRVNPEDGALTTLNSTPFRGPSDSDSSDCSPSGFTLVEGVLFFRAESDGHGCELWQTDGTPNGTRIVADVWPGPLGSKPYWIRPNSTNEVVYFRVMDPGMGEELWAYKRQSQAALLAVDFNQVRIPAHGATAMGANDEYVYFGVREPLNWGLARTDGTAAGTILLGDFGVSKTSTSSFETLFAADGTFWFLNWYTGKLYRSRGTPESSELFWDFNAHDAHMLLAGDKLYVSHGSSRSGGPASAGSIWVIDGASQPTLLYYREWVSGLRLLLPLGQSMLFLSDNDIWRTEGTEQTTEQITDIAYIGTDHDQLVEWRDSIYFPAGDFGTERDGLWRSDGTATGTSLVRNYVDYLRLLTPAQSYLYFVARTQVSPHSETLWRTDGTEIGTSELPNLFGMAEGDSYETILALDDTLYVVVNQAGRRSLWATSGTTGSTRLLSDSMDMGEGDEFETLFVHEDKLYMVVSDLAQERMLWVTDGTESGTELLHTVIASSGVEYFPGILNFMPAGDRLVFKAGPSYGERSIWITDGTVNGTELLIAEQPDANSGELRLHTYFNEVVLFGDLWAQPLAKQDLPTPSPTPTELPTVSPTPEGTPSPTPLPPVSRVYLPVIVESG